MANLLKLAFVRQVPAEQQAIVVAFLTRIAEIRRGASRRVQELKWRILTYALVLEVERCMRYHAVRSWEPFWPRRHLPGRSSWCAQPGAQSSQPVLSTCKQPASSLQGSFGRTGRAPGRGSQGRSRGFMAVLRLLAADCPGPGCPCDNCR